MLGHVKLTCGKNGIVRGPPRSGSERLGREALGRGQRKSNAGVDPFMGGLGCGSQLVQVGLRLRDQFCFVVAGGTQVHKRKVFDKTMERTFTDEAAFRAFARDFARTLVPGDVVGLTGPLGAGKTTFVQAAAAELLGTDAVSSPTFTFWHRYGADDAGGLVDHIDLYRIDDPREMTELGLDDAFEGSSIVFVEWWENAGGTLPEPGYRVSISGKGEEPRSVSVTRA